MTQQLNLFPTVAHLRRIEPERQMHRFYRLALQPNLFGGCTLVCECERIGSGGRLRHNEFPSEGQAVTALISIVQTKARRGYAPIG